MKVNDTDKLQEIAVKYRSTYTIINSLKHRNMAGITVRQVTLDSSLLTEAVCTQIIREGIKQLEILKTKLMLLGVDDFDGYPDIKE